ncbi:MAG: histidine phosphatase family protein [Planctomycetes bacterium]|nr:histidine phosphatase family protein [Planctomycetota bacterium]
MMLVLFRHGIAQELEEVAARPGEAAPRDEDRALTERGRRRVFRAAKALKKIGIRAPVIVQSGLRRAAETALLLAERLLPEMRQDAAQAAAGAALPSAPRHDARVIESSALVPDAPPRELFELLPQWKAAECVIAVGHAPHLDRVVALALGAQGRIVTELGKAAAVALEVPTSGRPVGQLLWLLPPKLLRRLGR